MMSKWKPGGRKAPVATDQVVAIERRGRAVFARIVTKDPGTRETPEMSVPLVAAINEAGKELRFLVIDVARLQFLNSTGLGMLVDLRGRVQAAGGIVVLFGMKNSVRQNLRTDSVDRFFTIVNSTEELKKVLG
jgi:anti-anti-sigma factor